jgi:hypothetical protein
MGNEKIVLGLLNRSHGKMNSLAAAKLRNFTLSWTRYGYHDLIIEGGGINAILDQASERGYHYCLVQSDGHIIIEEWHPQHSKPKDFYCAIMDWIDSVDFFVTGYIVDGKNDWHGLSAQCLLVNLDYYQAYGRPEYDLSVSQPIKLPKAIGDPENHDGTELSSLRPSGEMETCLPKTSGWNFVNVSLTNGMAVYNFDETVRRNKLYLQTENEPQAEEFARCLGQNAFDHAGKNNHLLTPDHKRFLNAISRQINNVKRGVFIWNLESYADVEEPPLEFKPPLSSLYSVAAGFKPNRILHTHGFDENTRVVFFDYSRNALEVKKLLNEEWDGEDYPRFLKHVFKKFPHPETFYHLWADLSPDSINWDDMEGYWRDEIDKWGGEQVIKDHWRLYKSLNHEYLHCDLLTEPHKMLEQIDRRPGAMIWWSNAFFTVYSNWLFTIDERKQLYDRWINGLAAKNPDIFLYGADYNNISVNHIQARPYLNLYAKFGDSYLNPYKLQRHEIRF